MNTMESLRETWSFFSQGGFFMILLLVCSLVALSVIVFKCLTLKRQAVVPRHLDKELSLPSLPSLEKMWTSDESSTLGRLLGVAQRHRGLPSGEVQEVVQSAAREELVRLSSGLSALEVVITIAPLLGLLGTASGLVSVFGDLGGSGQAIGRGIAMALSTTIAGIAVCVPSVIAHSFFSRKIERYGARLEVLLNRVLGAGADQK